MEIDDTPKPKGTTFESSLFIYSIIFLILRQGLRLSWIIKCHSTLCFFVLFLVDIHCVLFKGEETKGKPIVVILVGAPGSGKSTFCEQVMASSTRPWVRICQVCFLCWSFSCLSLMNAHMFDEMLVWDLTLEFSSQIVGLFSFA